MAWILQEKINVMKFKMLVMIALCSLFVSGCARFIVPEIGAIAQEENRVPYDVNEKLEGVLDTKDVYLEYILTESDSGVDLTGELIFDRSLTDSFPTIKTFFLKMSWLDVNGRVLQVVDVTPLYSYLGYAPPKLKINKKLSTVQGSKFVSFSYYGVFQGERPDVSEEWDILLFPYTTP